MTEPAGAVFGILVNAALLLSVAALFELAPLRRAVAWSVRRQIAFGVGLGCVGVLLMANPWLYVPGILFDVRSVLLALAGLFFGALPTCIAMAITAVYRYTVGGAATVMGIMVIVSSGLMGTIWRFRRHGQVHDIPATELYLFGLAVHIVMVSMMLYLPWGLAMQTIRDIGIPVLTLYPVVTMVVGMLMVAQARRLRQLQEMEANEERLRLALAAGDLATFDLDVPGNRIQVNAAYQDILGYDPEALEIPPPLWLDHIHPEDKEFVQRAFEAHVLGRQQEFREEFRLRTTANGWIWVLVLGRVVAWDESGAAKRMLGTLSDITARKHAEAAVRESEEQLRQIITHSLSGIIILDALCGEDGTVKDFEVMECNAATELHTRIQRASAIGRRWSEIDPYSFSSHSFTQITQALETGQPAEWEAQTRAHQRILHCIAYRIGSRRVAAVLEDITERRKAEEAREREATRRRILVEQAEDGIIVMDQNRRIVEANRGFADMLGLPADQVLGLSPWDFDANYCTQEKLLAAWPELLRTPSLLETQWRRSDGSIIDVEISCNPVEWGGQQFHFDVCRNITPRKRSEHILRLQAAALSAAANAIVIADRSGKIEWVNRAWCELTGYTMEEAIGQNPRILKSSVHDDGFYSTLWSTILSGEVWQSEIVNRRKDGTLYIEEEIIAPVLDSEGRPTHFVGVKQDITRRKEDEETLRESEERFRRAMVNAPFPTMLHAEDGSVLEVSHSWCELTGYAPDELPTVSDWVQKAYGDDSAEAAAEISTLYDATEAVYEGCFEIRTKSGDARMWEFGAAPLGRLPDGRRVVLSMAMDVTEQRRAEADRNRLQEQLQQVQKMESVGRLAGGVAHDFNNMISAILGNAELALSGMTPDDRIYDHLKEIVHAAERSADLTRQLLAFARRQAVRPEYLNLNEVIGNMLKMLQRLIGEDIDLNWHPGHALWHVKIDPSQFDQILANLVVNARDAISNVGKITIETANVHVDAHYASSHAGFVPGEYVLLTVSDNGGGMDHDTLEQIFEPFFTTKHLHQGTGLGLATVYGIVKQNTGYINVYSEPGNGSSFRVYLPRSEQVSSRPVSTKTEPALVGGHETLLVVEDEPAIRNVVHRVLTSCGYSVVLASSPEEALALVDNAELSIQMLLTDVVLPGMNGRDLTQAILARRPNLRVLYMSGYTANVIAHHGVLEAGVDFLQKPFSIASLTEKVREVLDRAEAETL